MSDPQLTDLNNILQAQTAALEEVGHQIEELTKFGDRNRWLIRIVSVALVLIAVLVFAVGGLAYVALHASHKAQRATDATAQLHNTQLAGCVAGNQARADNKNFWLDLVNTFAAGNPDTKAKSLAFINNNALFQPRDCAALYPEPKR